MRLDIRQICGKNTVTRDDGKVIFKLLIENWEENPKIEIDLDNLLVASVSFIDEAFGKLALQFCKEDMQNKLVFENMVTYDRKLLNDILMSRFRQQAIACGEKFPKRKRKSNGSAAAACQL
ncbi:MAG: STAS-like domain-containing protein [Syntrophobacteraceae bacterium]